MPREKATLRCCRARRAHDDERIDGAVADEHLDRTASTSATTTPDARVVASVTVSGGQRFAATAAVTSTSRTTISTTSSIAGLLRLGTGLEARAGFVLVFAGAAGFKFTPLR